MRRSHAFLLDGILARFRKNAGIDPVNDLRTGALQRRCDPLRRIGGIDQHSRFRLAEGLEDRDHAIRLVDRGHGGEMVDDVLRHAPRVDEHVGLAGAAHDGLGEHDRRERHVAAANVEKPRHRIGKGEDRRIDSLRLEALRDLGELVVRLPAGELGRLDLDRLRRP